jgi:hypothetical protein
VVNHAKPRGQSVCDMHHGASRPDGTALLPTDEQVQKQALLCQVGISSSWTATMTIPALLAPVP